MAPPASGEDGEEDEEDDEDMVEEVRTEGWLGGVPRSGGGGGEGLSLRGLFP